MNGAHDPLTGMVAELSEAKALAALVKGGWKPKRTLVYAAWDGEELGLMGSTEWVETHAAELSKKAVVYLNTDGNGRGFLDAGGSHTLEKLVDEVARDVVDPEKKVSVYERQRARRLLEGTPEARKEARESTGLRLDALGSGSDCSAFLQHSGIASLNLGYGGESDGGSYHSIYDSFDHFTRFGDPDFAYGVTLAKTAGRVVLRLANADVLPFAFEPLAETVGALREGSRRRWRTSCARRPRRRTASSRRSSTTSLADPKETFVAPKPKAAVPFLNFAPLQNAVAVLQKSAAAYAKAEKERKAPLAPDAQKRARRAPLHVRARASSGRKASRSGPGTRTSSTRRASTRATASRRSRASARPSRSAATTRRRCRSAPPRRRSSRARRRSTGRRRSSPVGARALRAGWRL